MKTNAPVLRNVSRLRPLQLESLESRRLLDANVLITEFAAANSNGIRDEDGDRSDWIEIHNAGDEAANLDGWFLTDDRTELNKWRLPPATLQPGSYRVVFASGKDRPTGGVWHTNFRLDGAGEYLALVQPNGQTIASDYGLSYPAQIDDYSFGIPQEVVSSTILSATASAKVLIPSDVTLGNTWTNSDFDDAGWMDAVTGIGFGQSAGFAELVGTDIKLDMIRARNSSAYLRIPFRAENTALVTTLELRMKYDDGFVAYLNGVEVARRNAPAEVTFDSAATEAHANSDAIIAETIDLTASKERLVDGQNVLAIQGLNLRFTDTDFLIAPELAMEFGGGLQLDAHQYFPDPTPGQPNGNGMAVIVSSLSHSPNVLAEDQALNVLASVAATDGLDQSLSLRYRVMYSAEVETPMFDDGLHGDGSAGDGVYGASIPAGAATSGEMLRYYVTLQRGEIESRWPAFRDPLDSEEYHGTIVRDLAAEASKLPVLYLFMQNPSLADTRDGTRGSMFYDGEFYDNVRIDLHGNLTAGFPRKSRDIDLNRDHLMRVSDDQRRVNDINLLTNYTDPSKMRSTLVYEAFQWAGAGTHFAFPVRTEVNGNFYAIYDFVEDGDDRFLERIGRGPDGDLYNMEGVIDSLTGADKRSGTAGDFSGLQSLVDGLMLADQQRRQFLYDSANLPAMANYLASLVITSYGDCCGKNYYVYQDSQGTGEWEAFPWDVNIAFGALSNTFDEMRTDRPLYTGADNHFFQALYEDPDFNQMYLRRLRTLMDEIYGPPGSSGMFEQRIDELSEELALDAPTDEAKLATIDDRRGNTWEYYVDVLRTKFVDGRRAFLYNTQTVSSGGRIPSTQPGDVLLEFGDIDVSPTSGEQDDEFIELRNPNDFAVDISQWSISGGVSMQFKPGTVIPANGSLYLSPNVNAFRSRESGPSGGQGLFVQGPYVDRLPSSGGSLVVADRFGRMAASTEFQGQPTPAELYLRISELMYHPVDSVGSGFDNDAFEFVELFNTSHSTPINLSNVQLDGGIQFRFSDSDFGVLEPGQTVLVVKDRVAMAARYGGDLPVAGRYEGQLSNGGENIRLMEGGSVILDFTYSDDWYPSTDGGGASLSIVNALATVVQWNTRDHWMASDSPGGSPGTFDARVPGDADGDGRFTSADLVRVLEAAKYEDGVPQNSSFADGDWNGDGEFDSYDLIFALQTSIYSAESRSEWSDLATAIEQLFAQQ